MRGTVRIFPSVLACLIAVLCVIWTGGSAWAESPARYNDTNVILISLQCLRPDHLGAYGYKRGTSPNIDKLAEGSVLFENAIAQANLTPVAQMSVFTSQYPRVHGMVSFEVTKDILSRQTLPEILKYYGYTTAAAVSSPEFFMRFDSKSGGIVNPGDVFSRSFDYFSHTTRGSGGRNLRKAPTAALQWIKDNKEKKFFLWIASGQLHMPYAASVPDRDRSMYDPPGYTPFWKREPLRSNSLTQNEDPSYEIFSRVYRNDFYWGFSPVYHLNEEDVRYVNGRYDAALYHTDRFIGELMDLLDSLGLTGKTLIVLHSIHGDDLGEGGRYFHYDITDTVIKNALMLRLPEGGSGGKRVTRQVQGIDLMPTILDFLGIPVPHDAQGVSLMPLISGHSLEAHDDDFAYIDRMPWWEYNLNQWYLEFQASRGNRFPPSEKEKLDEYRSLLKKSFDALGYPPGDIAIRSNEWKLVLRKNSTLLEKVSWWKFITGRPDPVPELELYDLKNDPLEAHNVAADNPEVVAKLKAKLLAWDASMEKQKASYRKNGKYYIIPYP